MIKSNCNNKKIISFLICLAMIFSMIPAISPVYADTGYDFQPPKAEENGMQSVKLLEPSDITVLDETTECYLNQINTPFDGTEDIEFSLTMTSGINNFSESNFTTNNMPVIKIYKANGNEKGDVAVEYSSGLGELKFKGSVISDEINNQGGQKTLSVAIGVDAGVLKSGDYILEFGKDFCGNNTSKKLGKDVRFKFTVKICPELSTMIEDAENFLADAVIGDAIGEYSQADADILQAEIDAATAELDAVNSELQAGTITETDAESRRNNASEKLYNALDTFKASIHISISDITISGISSTQYSGDSGTVSANVTVEPDSSQYKGVRWEASDNIIIDAVSGKWTAAYAGEGWVKAVSTADPETSKTFEVDVVNASGSAGYVYGSGVPLEEALGDDISGITALKIFNTADYTFTKDDLTEIRNLMPSLKTLDMRGISITAIGGSWFKDWTTLEKIVMPENLTEIGTKSFYGCTGLKEFDIPASVKKIGSGAFAGCTGLDSTQTVMAANPPELPDPDPAWGIVDSFNGGSSDKAASVTTFKVPYGCKEDYEAADYWNRYSFVEMEEKVLTVNFTSSGTLKTAAEKALAEKGWTDDEVTKLIVTSPEGVTLEKATDIKYLQTNFLGVTTLDLSGTEFANSNLQASTFEGRRNMKYIELPDEITHIGKKVFYGCSNLRSLTIPEGVYYQSSTNPGIGESSLAGCDRLETLIFLPIEPPGYNSSMPTSVKEVYVPNLVVDEYKDQYPTYRDIIKPMVTVSVEDVTVEAQSSETLTASVESPIGYDGELKWEITTDQDPENPVATIDSSTGKLTAHRYGTVKVKVTAGYNTEYQCSATCQVTVTKAAAVELTAGDTSYNKIGMSWTPMNKAEGYQIFKSDKEDGEFEVCETVSADTTSYTDTGLDPGKTYYYKVRGYKTVDGTRVYGEYSGVISVKAALEAPSGVKVNPVASSGKPKITWNKVDGASKYEVYRSTSKDGTYTRLGSTTNTYYTNTGATAGTTYYYKVKAICSEDSAADSKMSSVCYMTCDLAQPSNVKVTPVTSSGKPKVSWSAVSGAKKYYVYRSTSKDGTYSYLGSTTNTYYTNTGATAGNTYYYKVKAVISEGSAANSAFSSSCYMTCDLAQPTGVKVANVASSGKPKVSWNAVSGAKKYYVYRSTSKNGTYSYLGSTTGTSYTNTGATAGKTYYYKVKAVISESSAANSALSSSCYITCDLAQPVVSISGTAQKGALVLTWNKVPDAGKYEIYRSTSKNGTYTKYATTTSTKYTNSSVTKGKYYYYKVKAVYSSNTNANSAYSSIVSTYVR